MFFMFFAGSKAAYSISLGLVILYILYQAYIQRKQEIAKNKTVRTFFILYAIFIGGLLAISAVYNINHAFAKAVKFVAYAVPCIVTYLALKDSKSVTKNISWGTWLGTICLCVPAIIEWTGQKGKFRANGSFASPVTFAMLLESMIPLLVILLYLTYKGKSKYRSLGLALGSSSLVTALISFFMSRTRGAIVGIIIGLVAMVVARRIFSGNMAFYKKKIILFLVLILAGIIGSFGFMLKYAHRSYDMERVLLMHSSIAMWQDHKVLGVGFGNWEHSYHTKYISPKAKEPNLPHAHNNFSMFFASTGTVGGLCYTIFTFGSLLWLLKSLHSQPDNAMLYAMLWAWFANFSHSFVDFTFSGKFGMRIYFCLWGITLASVVNYKKYAFDKNSEKIQ